MEMNFIPECYFDTVLVKNILKVKKVNHQKSCFEVERTIKMADDFAVGIIDKDKVTINYLSECRLEIKTPTLHLWKHNTKHHYIIQLIPAIERWVLAVAKEGGVSLEDLNLPEELVKLTNLTKYRLVKENEDLNKLCKKIVNSNSETMKTLSRWLNYLLEHNRNADINVLKENV